MKASTRIFLLAVLIDFLLLNVALFSMQYSRRGILHPSPLYTDIFMVYFLAWVIAAFAIKKFKGVSKRNYYEGLFLIAKSNLLIAFLVSFAIVGLQWISVSRIQTFGSCALFFLLEVAGFSLFSMLSRKRMKPKQAVDFREAVSFSAISYPLLIIDGLLLAASFFVMNYLKRGNFFMVPQYDQIIMILYAIWLPATLITTKFDRRNPRNYLNLVNRCIKSFIVMVASLAIIVFAFRLFYYSRLQIFGTLAVFLIFELAVFRLYSLYRRYGKDTRDTDSIDEVRAVLDREKISPHSIEELADGAPVVDPVEGKLEYALGFFSPELFEFISEKIDLSKIDRANTALLSTDNMFNIRRLDTDRLRLVVNLHKINDFRWQNRFFLEVQSKMAKGGYFVAKAHTIDTHRRYFLKRYPAYIVELLYGINFVWRRVCPKLPLVKTIYFTLTQGRNRMISKAEVFGRLYFCGFKVVAEREIGDRLFIIAQKTTHPSLSQNPSYGPLIKLNRTGYMGKSIEVYKFRTMHPYSEYLQEYIFEKNRLQKGGKFKHDFRITSWGEFMRKTWLDELPMLYNWVRGDLKYFGVRPLSKQYHNLYSDELKELRKKVKPGLIPPFYADLPESLSEIMESETRYIKSYLKNPLRTQYTYLWKSFINIVINSARSN